MSRPVEAIRLDLDWFEARIKAYGASTVTPGRGGAAARRRVENFRAGASHWRAFCEHVAVAREVFDLGRYDKVELLIAGAWRFYAVSLEARLSQADVDTLAHGVGLSGRPEPAPDLNRQIEEAVDDARRPDRTESWAIQTAMKRKPKLFSGKSQRAVAEMLRRRRLKACTE